MRWVAIWRTLYYLPAVVSGAAVAVLWSWILNPEFGIVNLVLRAVGINGPNWLGDPRTALPSLILVSLWGFGGSVVIYLAGLQGIPTDLYEAAEVDGGQRLAPVQQRDAADALPGDPLQPGHRADRRLPVLHRAVRHDGWRPAELDPDLPALPLPQCLQLLRMGYASALAWVLFVVVLLLTLAVFRSTPMWVHYEGQKAR